MLLLYFNVITCNLTLLSFIVVFSRKFELCLLPNIVAIVFLYVIATGSGEKTRTQRVWVRMLFYHLNILWARVVISDAGLGSMKPTPVGTCCHPYLEDGKIKENGRMAWWRNLRMFREGVVLNVGRWFEDNIKRGVGNGKWEIYVLLEG
jgi:hypothetical protein